MLGQFLFLSFAFCNESCLYVGRPVSLPGYFQSQGGIECLRFLRSHPHRYRTVLVRFCRIAESAFLRVVDIQALLFDHLLHQVARLDDLHFVVEFACHGNHAQRLHVLKHVASSEAALFGVALLDKHRGVDVVDRCLKA